jgi:Flp pilus assembly protein TadD
MKLLLTGALVTGLMGVAAHAQPTMNIETAYPKGSIGYEALLKGDNAQAVSQILTSAQVSRHDPAKLLNLGRAYARMGRMEEASNMFAAAMQSRDTVDLVLADGRVMNSKDAARKAYVGLQMRIATR